MNPYKDPQLFRIAQNKAKKLNVIVKPSSKKYKKIDVFSLTNNRVISIGDTRYEDYNMHKDKRRRDNYKKRFDNTRHKKGTASYYADKILW